MTDTTSRTFTLDPQIPWERLADTLQGRLVLPDDDGFAAATSGFNLAAVRRPAAVVEATSAQDVVAAVRFAGSHHLGVSVSCTGHGGAADDSGTLLVRTGLLGECSVEGSRVRVGAGVRWQQVLDATAGLGAALCGSAPDVSVVGYTTGGGAGPFVTTLGLACDRVRAVEIVTGDGELRRVEESADGELDDLLWAVRGGKGLAGIVTALEFDLATEVPAQVFAGAVYFDGADAADVLHCWQSWSNGLPAQATTSVAVLRLPALPGVPPPLAGRTTIAVRFGWTGDPVEGERVFSTIRACATAVLDGVHVIPYGALGMIHADPTEPVPGLERHVLLSTFTSATADALLAVAGPDSGAELLVVEVRRLGGAARTGSGAFCHRDARFSLLAVGLAFPPIVAAATAAAEGVLTALTEWSAGATLPNFTHLRTVADLVTTYDTPTLTRLSELVQRVDPHGVMAEAHPLQEWAASRS